MEELVKYMAERLVEKSDEVKVESKPQEDGSVVIELHVAEDDMGRVIGKQGRIAKAIRMIVRAASSRGETKYTVEIV